MVASIITVSTRSHLVYAQSYTECSPSRSRPRAAHLSRGTLATFTSLNCLLLTHESLYAFCRVNPYGPIEDADPEYYTLRYRTSADSVVISSSGWGRGWQDLADGDLLVVRRRSLETFLVAGEDVRAA